MNTRIPADRVSSSRSTLTIIDPNTPTTITSTSSFTCSSTPCPVPNRTRLAFRSQIISRVQITSARSSAVAATSLRFTEFFGLAEPPSPTSRRHIQDADGITEGLDRVAHSGVTSEQRPGLGLHRLIGGREPDTALVNAQRHRTGCGVLIEPVTLLHHQQHHVQALALAQCDRVSPTLLPRLLLAQAGDLGGQVEALQRSVQWPLGFRVRPRCHTLSSLNSIHRRARAWLACPRSWESTRLTRGRPPR